VQVHRIPALSDNYIFLLYEPSRQIAAVVDPAEAVPVLQRLQQIGAKLVAIFNTHHHGDHVGGNAQLLQHFPDAAVYAGAVDEGRIPGQTHFLREGDRVSFAQREGHVLFVPGHTRGHIAYYFPHEQADAAGDLFCGDTLFAGGCGRLFEGTPAQMVDSLSKLRDLPDNTRVWCAHEYTLKNLQFAISVEPNNLELQTRLRAVEVSRRQQEPTVPSWIGIEKHTNPFLRWNQAAIQQSLECQDPVETFAKLRGMKDRF
jgi:hydroxyacylglutathione hydrolase